MATHSEAPPRICSHISPPVERVRRLPAQLAARAEEHPRGQRDEGHQDDRAGERLVLADALHAVAGDDHLDDPERGEADPAEHRQAEEVLLRQRFQARHQGDQQHVADQRGQVGLDAEPDDGHAAADQRRDLRAAGAEADPAHHRERHAGLDAHVAGQGEQDEQERRAETERGEDLPGAQPEGEQADREGVVAEAVHVVGPQREDVVRAPGAALLLGRGQVPVVEAGIDAGRHGLVERGAVVLPLVDVLCHGDHPLFRLSEFFFR